MAGCLVCPSYSSTNGNNCLICDTTTSSCITDDYCTPGYYLMEGLCFKCPVGCSTCNNGSTCTTCDTPLLLYTNITNSYCDCIQGKYSIVSSNILTCYTCHISCAYCQYNSTYCTYCSSGKYLMNGTCISPCTGLSVAMYNNATDRTCRNCGTLCSVCTNSTYCTTCNTLPTQTWNHNGVCLSTCPTGSLAVVAGTPGYKCNDCTTGCSTCVGTISVCTACNYGYNLYGSTCVTACPYGYYADTSAVCQLCSSE